MKFSMPVSFSLHGKENLKKFTTSIEMIDCILFVPVYIKSSTLARRHFRKAPVFVWHNGPWSAQLASSSAKYASLPTIWSILPKKAFAVHVSMHCFQRSLSSMILDPHSPLVQLTLEMAMLSFINEISTLFTCPMALEVPFGNISTIPIPFQKYNARHTFCYPMDRLLTAPGGRNADLQRTFKYPTWLRYVSFLLSYATFSTLD